MELLDYLGFVDTNHQQLFEPHLRIEEGIQKIKEGLLFEGKLYVDRHDNTLSILIYTKTT
jgi:hypothetical protein